MGEHVGDRAGRIRGRGRPSFAPRGVWGLLYYSREKLGNCTIKVVYKLGSRMSNSGLYIRIADKPADPWYAPSTTALRFRSPTAASRPGARARSAYTSPTPRLHPAKAGEWNVLEVAAEEPVTTAINGTPVADFDASTLKPQAADTVGEGDPREAPTGGRLHRPAGITTRIRRSSRRGFDPAAAPHPRNDPGELLSVASGTSPASSTRTNPERNDT